MKKRNTISATSVDRPARSPKLAPLKRLPELPTKCIAPTPAPTGSAKRPRRIWRPNLSKNHATLRLPNLLSKRHQKFGGCDLAMACLYSSTDSMVKGFTPSRSSAARSGGGPLSAGPVMTGRSRTRTFCTVSSHEGDKGTQTNSSLAEHGAPVKILLCCFARAYSIAAERVHGMDEVRVRLPVGPKHPKPPPPPPHRRRGGGVGSFLVFLPAGGR